MSYTFDRSYEEKQAALVSWYRREGFEGVELLVGAAVRDTLDEGEELEVLSCEFFPDDNPARLVVEFASEPEDYAWELFDGSLRGLLRRAAGEPEPEGIEAALDAETEALEEPQPWELSYWVAS